MKTVTYDYDNVMQIAKLLNDLPVHGLAAARLVAKIGDLIDTGKIEEHSEKEDSGSDTE